jgi:hypothetical protein
LGQTLCSTVSTQSAQNVHSKLQMRATSEWGGRSTSQHSQFGLISSAMRIAPHSVEALEDSRPAGWLE